MLSFLVTQVNGLTKRALCAAYLYDFVGYSYHPQFDLSAYVSHAPSKDLSTVTGVFTQNGMVTPFIDQRRIAGSNGAGISPGVAIMPWQGGRLCAAVNYDSVRYDTKSGSNEDAIGFGGTVGLNQALSDNLGLGLAAAFRQPFNNYAANLSWNNVPYFGNWTLGVFGEYTVGKNTLPDTYNVGLSADFFFDKRCGAAVPMNLKGDLKGEVIADPISDSLLAWTADPAVYMPQVLAIVDPNTTICPPGNAPVLTSAIPNIGTGTGIGTVNEAIHFSGSNLTFSIASITPVLIPPESITITPNGMLSFSNVAGTHVVVIKAANACGSVLASFRITRAS